MDRTTKGLLAIVACAVLWSTGICWNASVKYLSSSLSRVLIRASTVEESCSAYGPHCLRV